MRNVLSTMKYDLWPELETKRWVEDDSVFCSLAFSLKNEGMQ